MKPQDMSGACWSCVHRLPIEHSVYLKCGHPDAIPSFLAKASKHPADDVLKVVGHEQGVEGGWFNWPFDFDPRWLVACAGYEVPGKPSGPEPS
jgi:hypothetical protein